MATQAHCAYCFESLAASLDKRTPLSLSEVEALWKQYTSTDPAPPSPQEPTGSPRIARTTAIDTQPPTPDPLNNKPAALSRLLAPSPATASSSSVQSTSSATGGASEASSATSKSSSRSSFFSRLRGAEKEKDKEGEETEEEEATEEFPLFVTWNVISKHGERRLRGCIGTFEPLGLDEGLRSYALTSAFNDTRFPPITPTELSPALECAVTLLTNFEPAASPFDWTIGTHGLRISFTHKGRRLGATYLPDVAREQGWTKEETLVSLMRKAGWSGRREAWGEVELGVVRYQGEKVALGFEEWREWRAWVEEEEERRR